jgi:hypothetical protein
LNAINESDEVLILGNDMKNYLKWKLKKII